MNAIQESRNEFEREREVRDIQNRRIMYSDEWILHQMLSCDFPEDTPKHFHIIFTKPDYIYKSKENNVHCWVKHMYGRMYTVSALEVVERGQKFFKINSWFSEIDDTYDTLKTFMDASRNEEVKKKLDAKINDSKSWMKILYQDCNYLASKRYQQNGLSVELPARMKKHK